MDAEGHIRARGGRMTVQRRLVLEALRQAKHHTTAEQISARIRAKGVDLEPSTVYRNLEALELAGVATHTHFDDRVTRWHRADIERHAHLVCRSCGEEREIAFATLKPLAARLRSEHGFAADLTHAAIVGSCSRCSSLASR